MTAIFGVLQALGLSERLAKILGPVLLILAILAALWGAYALIHHDGEQAGAAKIAAKVERQHSAAVADARHDEQAAQASAGRIADQTARTDAATIAHTSATIEDIHHAFDAVPPAPPGALPVAPVDRLRDDINAAIARANRAAEAAGSAGGNDADDHAPAAHR